MALVLAAGAWLGLRFGVPLDIAYVWVSVQVGARVKRLVKL